MNRLKRTLAAVTAAIICTMGTPAILPELTDTVTMTASANYEYGNLKYALDAEGAIFISGCDESVEVLEIPAEIDGKAVVGIEGGAFSDCTSLTSVTIPESVTQIGNNAFCGCTSLTSVTIPEGVTEIGNSAFTSCTSLESITIPKSVTKVNRGTFKGCTSLTSITIPEGVTEIGEFAFFDCISLMSATIPESVTKIGERAFSHCTSLTSIMIPKSVTEIYEGAFYGCTSLTSITIPEGVTRIDSRAFSGCTSLPSIEVDSGNKHYTSEDGVLFSKDKSRLVCFPGRKEGAYVIPESVKEIDYYAFSDCIGLTSITIPESATNIDYGVFCGCTSLTSIEVDSGNENFVSEDGVLFSKDKSKLICCPSRKEGAYVIPESVTEIDYYAFYGCTSLTSITIPESVTEIWGWAFAGCTSLTSITIPEGVTQIVYEAFSGCTSLTSITIPESVMSIYEGVFDGCESLTDVYYTGTIEQWLTIEIWERHNDSLAGVAMHFNSTAPVTSNYGDIDGNGKVDIMDVILLNRNLMIGAEVTPQGLKNADVDCNGEVDSLDALNILKYVTKLITNLPV